VGQSLVGGGLDLQGVMFTMVAIYQSKHNVNLYFWLLEH
jgi:hypothetical protein